MYLTPHPTVAIRPPSTEPLRAAFGMDRDTRGKRLRRGVTSPWLSRFNRQQDRQTHRHKSPRTGTRPGQSCSTRLHDIHRYRLTTVTGQTPRQPRHRTRCSESLQLAHRPACCSRLSASCMQTVVCPRCGEGLVHVGSCSVRGERCTPNVGRCAVSGHRLMSKPFSRLYLYGSVFSSGGRVFNSVICGFQCRLGRSREEPAMFALVSM